MPKKIGSVTRSVLLDAPIPTATKSYTVITHAYAINTILQNLHNCDFQVLEEHYRCTVDAKVAHGTFVINYSNDPELQMTYSFSNSYDKTLRFKSAVGVQIQANKAYMISEMDHWRRKHTGTADDETEELIKQHITNAQVYFEQLRETKESMKKIEISKNEFGQIIGELFINNLLSVDQMSMVLKEYENPSFKYLTGPNNLWTCYNHILHALKFSHPSKWMQYQIAIHFFMLGRYNLVTFDTPEQAGDTESIEDKQLVIPDLLEQVETLPVLPGFDKKSAGNVELENVHAEEVIDPAQTDLLDAIEELEKEEELPVKNEVEEIAPEDLQAAADKFDEMVAESSTALLPDSKEPVTTEESLVKNTAIETPPMEEVNTSVAVEKYEEPLDKTKEIAFPVNDFQGIAVGECFEAEDVYYQVLRIDIIEGEEYLITKALVDAMVGTFEPEILLPTAEPVKEMPVVSDQLPEDVLETQSLPETESSLPDELHDSSPEIDQKLTETISKELEEIYGQKQKFTFTRTETQYNIVLESGETITLSTTYIDSLL